ncbi:GAP family protein [Conyzicola sp.]|uniref:GAP family protein n=1 Tax=Conyzicola sp. TaxID=1969404 RepID=UPI0039891EB6
MFEAIGTLLPLALAVALSSVPITATTFILLSANRDRTSLPFLAGWILGIFGVAFGFALGFSALPQVAGPREQPIIGIIEIVIGVALIGYAVSAWRRVASRGPRPTPKWLTAVGRLGPVEAFGLAVGMNFRPKALLLSAAVGVGLNGATVGFLGSILSLAIYTLIGASTVIVPVVFTYVSPARAELALVRVRGWFSVNSAIVTVIVVAMTGVVIAGNGLTRL